MAQTAGPADVYVVGTLYRRHAAVPAYDLPALRRLMLAIKPDILVLDCTPAEIAAQTVHASKIEYAGVVFPLVRERGYPVYAAEPAEPMFSEIVQAITAENQAMGRDRPEIAKALAQFTAATYAALAPHWQSVADVQDSVTAQALAGKSVLVNRMTGPAAERGWARWNQHWADAILRAAAEHPGKRILALTGIENRPWIVEALGRAETVRVVDVPRWLREHAALVETAAPAR